MEGLREELAMTGTGDADDNELQGLRRGDPDFAQELAGVHLRRQDRVPGGSDEVGLRGRRPREGAPKEEACQELTELHLHLRSQRAAVRFEDGPLQLLADGALEERDKA